MFNNTSGHLFFLSTYTILVPLVCVWLVYLSWVSLSSVSEWSIMRGHVFWYCTFSGWYRTVIKSGSQHFYMENINKRDWNFILLCCFIFCVTCIRYKRKSNHLLEKVQKLSNFKRILILNYWLLKHIWLQ